MTLVLVFVLEVCQDCGVTLLICPIRIKICSFIMQFLLKEGGTIDNTLQDEHFYQERSRIITNAPLTHERIIAAFVLRTQNRIFDKS